MTEDELKEMLDDFASASRPGEWDIARAARLAVPALIAEVRRLREQNARMREVINELALVVRQEVNQPTRDFYGIDDKVDAALATEAQP